MKLGGYCVFAAFLFVFTGSAYSQKDCTLLDDCSCSMTDGSGTIDLTSLGNTDGTPRFKDVVEEDEGYFYSYNPCGAFDEADCRQATACVLDQDKSQSQQIGDSGRAAFKFDDDSGNVIAAYTSGTGVLKLTTVNLICDKSACKPSFTPQGEQGAGQFEMTLKTVCACPGMCTASGPGSCSSGGLAGGLSGGSILLIAFVTILFIYVVGGVLFMKFRNQASGTDLIPNKALWISVPGLVVTGFKFIINKVMRRQDASYEKI